jgi:hypothetical protein
VRPMSITYLAWLLLAIVVLLWVLGLFTTKR